MQALLFLGQSKKMNERNTHLKYDETEMGKQHDNIKNFNY